MQMERRSVSDEVNRIVQLTYSVYVTETQWPRKLHALLLHIPAGSIDNNVQHDNEVEK